MTDALATVKTVSGIPIEILPDGRFRATIGHKVVALKDLREVERRILATLSPVKAIRLSGGASHSRLSIVGGDGKNWKLDNGGSVRGYGVIYVADEAVIAELEALESEWSVAREEYHRRERELRARLTPLTLRNIEEVRAAQQATAIEAAESGEVRP